MTGDSSRCDDPGNDKEALMAIGPVQLIVLGFDEPKFQGEILAELDRLKESDIVRVIDGLAVHKDAGRRSDGLEANRPERRGSGRVRRPPSAR
jgi:hypothetical protein